MSSPSDAQEYGLGVITPNHPKTCSREQFSRYQGGGRSLLNSASLPKACGCPSLSLPLFSLRAAAILVYHCLIKSCRLSVMNVLHSQLQISLKFQRRILSQILICL